jgi:hypothetical protein
MSDWVPSKDAEFDTFFKRYCQYVNTKCTGGSPEWTHIPADRRTELNGAYAAWFTAYGKLSGPHTPADVLAKDEAKAANGKILREFNNQYILYAREVSDADRREIGAHVHDPTPTAVPRPTAQPGADITYPGRHLLELRKIRPVAGGGDDLRSDWGVRIFWGVMGEATAKDTFRLSVTPVTGDDLPHSTFTKRKKYRFDFDGDSGKTVWFSLRYENEKGGRDGEGPFGPLFSAVIP